MAASIWSLWLRRPVIGRPQRGHRDRSRRQHVSPGNRKGQSETGQACYAAFMSRGILKVDPLSDSEEEHEFSLAYLRSLSTAERFRMTIERSILLLRLAAADETDRETPPLTKRR